MRSLGAHGLRVLAAGKAARELAGTSRYCTEYLRCPSTAREPVAFVEWLLYTVSERDIRFLLPVTEITSQLLLAQRQRLPGQCILPFPDLETVMRLADKGKLVQLATAHGVRCPDTRFVDQPAAFDTAEVKRFPVVLKPCLSQLNRGDHWLSTAVAIARDPAELEQLLHKRSEFREHPFLVQEFVPGIGAGVFALYDHGREIVNFAHCRLREKPPTGGVSVLSESVIPSVAALDMTRTLLSAVRWHGVAMVEVRITPEGTPYLMEVNTRLWGSLQLAIDAGVDFPWLLYQVCTGQSSDVPATYATGKRLRWWLGDLDSLYLYLRDTRYSTLDKVRRVVQFFTPDPGRTRHEIFRWSDPAPAWHELRAWFAALRG
jgi:predicted ATP-grasp superfamily ATP-dependent carboligase